MYYSYQIVSVVNSQDWQLLSFVAIAWGQTEVAFQLSIFLYHKTSRPVKYELKAKSLFPTNPIIIPDPSSVSPRP